MPLISKHVSYAQCQLEWNHGYSLKTSEKVETLGDDMPRNSVKHSKSPTMSNIIVAFHHINFQPLWWSPKFHVSDLGRPAEVSQPSLFSAMSPMGIPQFPEAWWNSLKLRPKLEGTIWLRDHLFKLWRPGNPWISKLSTPAGNKVGWQTRCGMMLIFCQHWFMLKWSELRWFWCVSLQPSPSTNCWWWGASWGENFRKSNLCYNVQQNYRKICAVFPFSFNLHVARGCQGHLLSHNAWTKHPKE